MIMISRRCVLVNRMPQPLELFAASQSAERLGRSDRFIQQAICGILTWIWEPVFSEQSYGFRPGRTAHQAVMPLNRVMGSGPAELLIRP